MLTNIKVIKKNGLSEPFNIDKMLKAINLAASDINYTLSDDELKQISEAIYKHLDGELLLPQDMHYIAMTATNSVVPEVTEAYKQYHYNKQKLKATDLQKLLVVNKSGEISQFDVNKIKDAAQKSARAVNKVLTEEDFTILLNEVAHWLDVKNFKDIVSTSDIHRLVLGGLKQIDNDIYMSYKRYYQQQREYATMMRELQEESDQLKFGSYNENANKDSQVISTKSALINEMTMKKLMRHVLNPEWIKAHDEGYIYLHDLGDLYKDTYNCNLFDLAHLMQNKQHDDGIYAFCINNKKTEEPKHVSSAFDVLSSITIAVSGNQFGGFTVNHIDSTLAPYAEKSYQHYLNDAKEYGIQDAERYATDKTLKEIKQGVQSYTYELAQTQNALGQTPFTTISFGMDTSKWGREITRAILEDRMSPDNRDVFPKLVFMYRSDVNGDPTSPNYDLFKLSLECSSKKLYPDYLAMEYEGEGEHYRRDVYERSGQTIAPMGCRAHLSPFIDPETGKDVTDGRFNIGAISLNPVKFALEARDAEGNFDKEKFDQLVEKYSNMVFDIQNWRYERVGNLYGSSNPLFWCEGGAWQRIRPDQQVKDSRLLDGATASIGYTGLYEMVNAMKGSEWESVTDEERKQIQADFLNHVNKIRIERSEKDNHPYALYSTPAESLVFTWEKLLTKQYGVIPGVTDRDYLTNSFHQPVWIHSSAIDKIDYEKEFHNIARGGHISYAEFNYGVSPASLEAIVKYAMRQGMYFGVNVISSVCEKCGEHGDFLMNCDNCGSENILVVERVCGYLTYSKRSGVQAVNDGKWSEIKERVRHGVERGQLGQASYAELHGE